MKSISHDEYLSGKYQSVSSDSSGNHEAKVWYKDNGSINEELTYSDNYQRSNGIGRYAKKSESPSKESSKSSSSSSRSSSSSSSSRSSSSTSSFTNTSKSKPMERELTYEEVQDLRTQKKLGAYLDSMIANCCDIYDESVIEKTRQLAEEVGANGDDALAKLYKYFKRHYDPEYVVANYGKVYGGVVGVINREVKIPTGCKKALLHYMNYALCNEYIETVKAKDLKEWMKKLNSAVTMHYSNDTEVQELYTKIKEKVEIRNQKDRKKYMIIGGAILIFLLWLIF